MVLHILYIFTFSGVGDLYFSSYNLSRILISLFNSFVIHGFLYIIFFYSKGKLEWKYCRIVSINIVKD